MGTRPGSSKIYIWFNRSIARQQFGSPDWNQNDYMDGSKNKNKNKTKANE